MKLIPFHKSVATTLMEWQLDGRYTRFFRGFGRYLTLDELERLPEINGETLIVYKDDVIGLVSIRYEVAGVAEYAFCLDAKYRNKGLGKEMEGLVSDYLFNTRCVRKIITHACSNDRYRETAKSLGYSYVGTLKEHGFVNGVYEDMDVLEKMRDK